MPCGLVSTISLFHPIIILRMRIFTRFLLFLAFCVPIGLFGQTTVTIATGTVVAPSTSFNSNPIYRSNAGSGFDYSQAIYLYTQAELAAVGIFPGAVIDKLAWNKTTAFGTVATGNLATWSITMKNSFATPSPTWSSTSFATQTAGATVVYTGSIVPAASGWLTLTFTTPFTYNGGALEIGSNWNCSATAGNPTTGGFSWLNRAVPNSVFGHSASSNALTLALQANRPDVQLTFTGGAPPTCFAPTGLTTANLTPNTVTLNWVAPTAGTPADYEFAVTTSATPPASGTLLGGTATTTNVSGLSANTTYYGYVRTFCGGTDYSGWASTGAFFTGYCQVSTGAQTSWTSAFSTTGGLTNISYTAAAGAAGGYQNLTNTMVFANYPGSPALLNLTAGGPTCGFAIWSDLNDNLVFETTERIFVTSAFITSTAVGGVPLTIPGTAAIGSHRARLVVDFNNSAPVNPCAIPTRGEYTDFTIEVVAAPPPPCASTPAPAGAATGVVRNPTLTWAVAAGATSYQVYLGTATNPALVATVTTLAYTPSALLTANTGYFWKVVPVNGAGAATGCTEWTFTTGAGFQYCTPVTSSGCTDGDVIAQVILNTLNNNSGTGCPSGLLGYSDYTTNTALTTNLQAGTSYSCQVWAGQFSESYAAWIDYDDNGVFDHPAERIGFTSTPVTGSGTVGALGSSASFPVALSCAPPVGVHRLRVRAMYNIAGSAMTPCGNNAFGETEDYLITIDPPPPCPQPGQLAYTAPTNTLTWVAGCTEIRWDLFIAPTGGTAPTGATTPTQAGLTALSYIPTGLTSSSTYEVWVRADCGAGSTSVWTGPVSFTVPIANDECTGAVTLTPQPFAAGCPAPTVGTTVGATASLTPASTPWPSSSDDDVWYQFTTGATQTGCEIRFCNVTFPVGTTANIGVEMHADCATASIVNANTAVTAGNGSVAFIGLVAATNYKFRVLTIGTAERINFDISVVEPDVPPGCATPLTPANTATLVPANTPLTWSAPTTGGAPLAYRVYIWETATTQPSTPTTTVAGLTYTPTLQLQNTSYSWFVAPVNSGGEATGCTIFSYTTEPPPPPPANNDPSGAIALTLSSTCTLLPATNASATATETVAPWTAIPAPTCASYQGGDVWFQFTVPAGTDSIIIDSQTGVVLDGGMSIYSSSDNTATGTFTQLECDDDDSANGAMPLLARKVEAGSYVVGNTYFVRFWEFGGNGNGTFSICARKVDLPTSTLTLTNTFIEGYMDPMTPGNMRPVMANAVAAGGTVPGVPAPTTAQCDIITVELHATTTPFALVQTATTILSTTGAATVTFPGTVIGNSYYVVLKGRNIVETWSAAPVVFTATASQSFTTAFGANLGLVGTVPVIFSGDINAPQDGSVDFFDYPIWEADYNNFTSGYIPADLNGDGGVDFFDYPIWEANYNNFIGVIKP
jgi:hypothetical protein